MHTLLIYLVLSSLLLYVVQGLIDQNSPTYGSHQLITYVVDWVNTCALNAFLRRDAHGYAHL